MLFLVCIAAILLLVLLMVRWQIPAFLAFILVAVFAGLGFGLSPKVMSKALQEGMAGTSGAVVGILALGSILGRYLGISGAAARITQFLLDTWGHSRARLALMVAGFLVGLPLFYSVAFILLAPLALQASKRLNASATYLGIPMLASLTVTQGYLPPHPAPLAILQEFGADMGLTLLYGIAIAIPAILISGYWYGSTCKNLLTPPNPAFMDSEQPQGKGLSLSWSMALLLFPILAMAIGLLAEGMAWPLLDRLANPNIALMLALLLAHLVLRYQGGFTSQELQGEALHAIKEIAPIFFIFAGAGAFKEMLVQGGLSSAIAAWMMQSQANPYVLGWGMAAIIRVCVGSSTVAGITAAGFMKTLVWQGGMDPNLMVLALGAGSMMFSHVNDTGFWLFRSYFNLNMRDTLRSWTAMDTLVSITGLLGVLVLDWFLGLSA